MNDSRFKESKAEGQVQFQTSHGTSLGNPTPIKVGGLHDTVFNLVEFDFSPSLSFWFGTAEIDCTLEGIARDADTAGLPSDPRGYAYDPFSFDLLITLSDGRRGMAKVRTSRGEYELNLEIQHVEFVGTSKLG